MATRRVRGRGWESRDAQCPLRGYGLHHVQNGSAACVFCGVNTYGPTTTVGQAELAGAAEEQITDEEVTARLDGTHRTPFTAKETRDLEFLRWLRENGRV